MASEFLGHLINVPNHFLSRINKESRQAGNCWMERKYTLRKSVYVCTLKDTRRVDCVVKRKVLFDLVRNEHNGCNNENRSGQYTFFIYSYWHLFLTFGEFIRYLCFFLSMKSIEKSQYFKILLLQTLHTQKWFRFTNLKNGLSKIALTIFQTRSYGIKNISI